MARSAAVAAGEKLYGGCTLAIYKPLVLVMLLFTTVVAAPHIAIAGDQVSRACQADEYLESLEYTTRTARVHRQGPAHWS